MYIHIHILSIFFCYVKAEIKSAVSCQVLCFNAEMGIRKTLRALLSFAGGRGEAPCARQHPGHVQQEIINKHIL